MNTDSDERIVSGLCGICPAGCAVKANIRNDKLYHVEADLSHPLGMICTIGRHSPQIVHDPDRVSTPLKRVGAKGTYDFKPISWDEAYDEWVSMLKRIKSESGAEATAIYTGRGSFDMAMCDLLQPADAAVSSASSILFPFGSPNTLGVGALCYVSFAMIAPHVTMGEMLITMDVDIEQAELIVLWGANPATDSPPTAHHAIVHARKRGAEVIAIDPRRNGTAREVDAEWIPARSGTDGALALSMIEVLIEEELYDEEFVRDWCVGFDDLANMTQHYRPEVVEPITGVPSETIRRTAHRIAEARGAAPVMYTGLEYSDSGVQAIRAVTILWALAGQLDVPGGWSFRMKDQQFPQSRSKLVPNPDIRNALGRENFPVYSQYRGESHAIALPDAILNSDPYKIRALTILGGSLITSWPNPPVWKETLGALDQLVCIDRYLTADAAYADLVLPATTMYEIQSFMRYGSMFKIRNRLVEPQGEARNDLLILSELAQRLGYGDKYPQSDEEILRWGLADTRFTLEDVIEAGGEVQLPSGMMEYKKWQKGLLRPDGKPGFNTPSGKFEIASSVLREHGYDPLPVYTEPAEGPIANPSLAKIYPLVLNTDGRTPDYFRSQQHGVEGLKDKLPEPTVWINKEDADERNISTADGVWVESPRGRVRYQAIVTDNIVRGNVDANMGGGGPLGSEAWRNCNINELTNLYHVDPISGFPVYKTLLCQVTLDSMSSKGTSLHESINLDSVGGEDNNPLQSSNSKYSRNNNSGIVEREVYLDHNATTPLDPVVLEAMLPFLKQDWGNPSSIHSKGDRARKALEKARRSVATSLNSTARRIVFTSGGSEANNLALHWASNNHAGRQIITSSIEHPAILATCRALEDKGINVTYLPVNSRGLVNPDDLTYALKTETTLVSIMTANNETGVIQPVKELAAIAKQHGALFHTDAVQALGKIDLDVEDLAVDMLSMSAHKVYGPKGIGAIYIREGIDIEPLIYGGGQERGIRSGTENVASIIGFGKTCDLARNRLKADEGARIAMLRDQIEEGMMRLLPGTMLIGDQDQRLFNTVNLSLPTIRGEALVLELDRKGIYFSSGSACKSGNPDPSHALLAMGLSDDQAHRAIRISLGNGNTEDDVRVLLEAIEETINDTFATIRFVGCR